MTDSNKVREVSILDDLIDENLCYATRSTASTQYNVYLDEEIGSPSKYRNLFEIFDAAEESDEVIIHVNNYGGNADTMVQILSAMRTTKARTITKIFNAGSAATYIGLAADSMVIDEFGTWMFHGIQWGDVGAVSNGLVKYDHARNSMMKLNKTYLSLVLSDEEIELIGKGDFNVWLSGAEVIDRIQEKEKERAEKEEKESKEDE